MKKIAVLLFLVLMTEIKGQVYALEYTSFQLFDSMNHKYYPETPVNVILFIDMTKKTVTLMDKQYAFFEVSISSYEEVEHDLTLHCVNLFTRQMWDLYITSTEHNNILKGKSGKETWIYKLPIK